MKEYAVITGASSGTGKEFAGLDLENETRMTVFNEILYYLGNAAPLSMRTWVAGKMFGPRSKNRQVI